MIQKLPEFAQFNFTKSLCIFATKRSGHHAVLNWIAMNMPYNVVHFNDIDINKLCAIDGATKSILLPKGDNHSKIYAYPPGKKSGPKLSALDTEMYILQKPYRSGLPDVVRSIEQEVISFENESMTAPPGILSASYFKGKKVKIIGVLRDFYNTLASELHSPRQIADLDTTTTTWYVPGGRGANDLLLQLAQMKACWLSIAYEYLNNPENVVLFNSWNLDKEYRDTLCARHGLGKDDYGFNTPSKFGGGSSFSDHAVDGVVQRRSNLHRRYETIIEMPLFRMFAYDPEIIELNKKIFNMEIF